MYIFHIVYVDMIAGKQNESSLIIEWHQAPEV